MSFNSSVQYNKKDIERLIEEKNASISHAKPKEISDISKCWSQISQIYVSNIKRDFIICDYCKSVSVYKSSTESDCMISLSCSCSSKENLSDLSNQQRKISHYYKSTSNEKQKVPKKIKNDTTLSCVEFVVRDDCAFQLLQRSGFIGLAKQLFDSDGYMASSIDI